MHSAEDEIDIVDDCQFEISKSSSNKSHILNKISTSFTNSSEDYCKDKTRIVANFIVGRLEIELLQTFQDCTILENQTLILECIVNRTDKSISGLFLR
ncbi:unnamed protein product [Rotaria sp. Silwood1]|nr:unnamed protein product [Rotaria sp. Silwood1]CAF3930673.1 unnamed protein product [Rotaria sp. Silwood1]CAF3976443.1 unnamed protein product [Rotaria sp. Silwood1]CAF4899232.1 unnamed protein product [Rotaria sp. Silwood1]CAF4956649.1 unnamed protein product [Rotaria sp. Silwood1]